MQVRAGADGGLSEGRVQNVRRRAAEGDARVHGPTHTGTDHCDTQVVCWNRVITPDTA